MRCSPPRRTGRRWCWSRTPIPTTPRGRRRSPPARRGRGSPRCRGPDAMRRLAWPGRRSPTAGSGLAGGSAAGRPHARPRARSRCALARGSRTVFTGDLLVVGSTVVIPASHGGSLAAYLASLARVAALGPQRALPAHGPPIDDPEALIAHYVAHRRQREQQVLEALAAGASTIDDIAARIYRGLDPALLPQARDSVLAHLLKLEDDGAAARRRRGLAPALTRRPGLAVAVARLPVFRWTDPWTTSSTTSTSTATATSSELKEYLAIPSISALPQHAADVRRCAEWTADELRRIGLQNVALDGDAGPSGGLRRVAGRRRRADDPLLRPLRRAAGRPAEPVDLAARSRPRSATASSTPAARSTTRARSSCTSRRSRRTSSSTGRLPVNIKFLLEGEEEVGSANLDDFIRATQGAARRRRRRDQRLADVRPRHPVDLLRPARPGVLPDRRARHASPTCTRGRSAARSPTRRWCSRRSSRR